MGPTVTPPDGQWLARLLSAPQHGAMMRSDWRATPVGRNQVWRLSGQNEQTLYAKHWNGENVFQRELIGLRLSATMATCDPRFTHAPVVAAYPETGFIVTEPIPGKSLADMIRDAFRKDRNPLRLSKRIAAARGAVIRVVDWLDAFHRQPTPDHDGLYSHSARSMTDRINRKLAKSHEGQSYAQRLGINQMPQTRPDDEPSSSLVMGDASLGNFYIDGDRVGATDFEDMGVGSGDRDLVILRYWLAHTLSSRTHYWDEELFALLPDRSASHVGRTAMIERLLLDFEQAVLNSDSRAERSLRGELCRLLPDVGCSTAPSP